MDSINHYLRAGAMQRGLCAEWRAEWEEGFSREELVERYKRGLDFCLQHRFPSVDFIVANFERDFLRSHGLYVREEDFIGGGKGVFVVQGGSYGELHFGGWDAATIWVADDSEVLVVAEGHCFVVVHQLDNSVVRVDSSGGARVKVLNKKD